MFLNRNHELAILQDNFEKPVATLNFIFGRKKVGKTALINQFTINKKCLYITSFEMTKDLFFQNLKNSVDRFFNVQNNIVITSTFELFKYISNQNIEEKIVFVIENVNDLINIDKNFIEDLNYAWNKFLKNKNIQIIITSSTFFSVENDIELTKKAHSVIKLNSLSNIYTKKALPSLSDDEIERVFAVFGTNSSYLKLYDENIDLFENIRKMCLEFNSPLLNEGIIAIKSELGDVVTYLSILHAVSIGNKKIGDIAGFLNLKSTYITRYMQKLVDIMILEKKFPIDDDPSKSKFGRYEFTDNFLKFWFCFVYPNLDLINQNKSSVVLEQIKQQFDEKILRDSYKDLVMDKIKNDSLNILGYEPFKVGSWWNNKDNQIDIIAYNSQYITFLDCKIFRDDSVNSLEEKLKEKSAKFNTSLSKKYLIFS